jgi:hypothetical protein
MVHHCAAASAYSVLLANITIFDDIIRDYYSIAAEEQVK